MRAVAWCLVWIGCVLVALWTLLAVPVSALFGSGRRGWLLAVGYDQLGNVAAGGDEDEVFSSRCWRMRDKWHYQLLVDVIDWIFRILAGEVDHCWNAWLAEQKKRGRRGAADRA